MVNMLTDFYAITAITATLEGDQPPSPPLPPFMMDLAYLLMILLALSKTSSRINPAKLLNTLAIVVFPVAR